MTLPSTITEDSRINEVIQQYPATVRVFHELGLDACCGGHKPIRDAAAAHGLQMEMVLDALNQQVRSTG